MKTAWENFNYTFIEDQSPWFDPDVRPKTALALRHLWERIPEEALEIIEDRIIHIFAPDANTFGEVWPLPRVGELVIYLAPVLEEFSQEEVDFTVAHEFAHVFRGDGDYPLHERPTDIETPTDRLTEEWGFVVPERRKKQLRSSVTASAA